MPFRCSQQQHKLTRRNDKRLRKTYSQPGRTEPERRARHRGGVVDCGVERIRTPIRARGTTLTIIVSAAALVVGGFVPLLHSTAAGAAAAQLRRYPYLTDLVGTSVNVNWATDRSASTASASGAPYDVGRLCRRAQRDREPDFDHGRQRRRVPVDGCAHAAAPGTYCYRVFLGTTDLLGERRRRPASRPRCRPVDRTPYSFAVFGDWGLADASGANADQANLMQPDRGERRPLRGDGRRQRLPVRQPDQLRRPPADRRRTPARSSARRSGPCPVSRSRCSRPSGNHGSRARPTPPAPSRSTGRRTVAGRDVGRTLPARDVLLRERHQLGLVPERRGTRSTPATPASTCSTPTGPTPTSARATSYADDYAAHWAPGQPRVPVAPADLAAHPSGLKFAFFHYPLYSDQKAAELRHLLQGSNSLEGLLAANRRQHRVQRPRAHLRAQRADRSGHFPTYVTGGGGGTLQPVGEAGCKRVRRLRDRLVADEAQGHAVAAPRPSPTRPTRVFHFLKVTVSGTTVTVTPTDEHGRTFDVQTYNFSSSFPTPSSTARRRPRPTVRPRQFTFHATAPGATFACALDGANPASCTSPATYAGLSDGSHTFTVRATRRQWNRPRPGHLLVDRRHATADASQRSRRDGDVVRARQPDVERID